MEIAAAGGDARPLLTPEQLRVDGAVSAAEILPGNDALLVTSTRPGGSTDADQSIDVLTTATGNRRVVIQGGTSPHYLPTGHIAFLRHGTLMAVPFDSRRLELAGTPVEVLPACGNRSTDSGPSVALVMERVCMSQVAPSLEGRLHW